MHTRARLTADLRALGVVPGDVLMVHASVRAVGQVVGGPDEIHLAIKDAIGTEGTLLMYAGCPRHYDEVGRGNLSASEEAFLLVHLPPFDARNARCARDHGILPEFLRTWPGSVVNDHVTRFVAWGRQAGHLFSEQPWDNAMGAGSALERFTALQGRILLLGSDHDNVTYLHYTEHVADFPDKRIARYRVPVLEHGKRVWRAQAEVDSSQGAHARWPAGFFAVLVDAFLARTGNTGGRVGNAPSYLIPAVDLHAFAAAEMQRVARGG